MYGQFASLLGLNDSEGLSLLLRNGSLTETFLSSQIAKVVHLGGENHGFNYISLIIQKSLDKGKEILAKS